MAYAIFADRIFDGEEFGEKPVRIEVGGGRIQDVRPLEKGAVPRPGDRDARGLLVLPGLINTHVHIVRGGMFSPVEPLSIAQIVTNFKSCLDAGVTTVGDMGSAAGLISSMREHTKAHPLDGPSVVCGGPLVTCPNGYPLDWVPGIYTRLGVALPCKDERDARKKVQWVTDRGMDFIKLAFMHRSYADKALPSIHPLVASAVVDKAHDLGYRVLAHAHSIADYRAALDAGVDALMHNSFELLDKDMVARVRDAGIPVTPTLWVFEAVLRGVEQRWYDNPRYTDLVTRRIQKEWKRFCLACEEAGDVFPPGIVAEGLTRDKAREAMDNARENTRLLNEAGVTLAMGNDSPYGFCLPGRPMDEMYAMERAGLSVRQCLRSATSNGAKLLNLKDRGRIRPGMRADLVFTDKRAANDLKALEKPVQVLSRGRRIPPETFSQRKKREIRTSRAAVRGLLRTLSWSLSRV